MTIMATKILSGWCWQSTIRHFLPPPRLFPVTSRHLAHPQFVPDNHQHRGFLNIWEGGRRRIPPFQFRPIVTSSWKSINFSTHSTVKWAGIEKLKNIESNIVFLQCPNISLCSCQDFPGECVECGGDPDPYQFYFSADPIDIFYDNSHPSYKTCFKLTGKEECCFYFKPTKCDLVQWQKSATSQAGQTRPREAALPSWHCSGIFRRIFRIRQIFSGHC